MSYLQIATGNMVRCPAGALLVGRGAEARKVAVAAFDLQDLAVTVAMWKAFQKEYAGQPFARFVQAPDGDLILTHTGRSEEALRDVPVAVVPGEPVPLSRVIKVVPTEGEYEARFRDYEAGARKLFLTGDHPVVEVDWFEAAAYAASIGGRLPTREEREYAARAGREGDEICGVGGDGRLQADNAWWSGPNHPTTAKNATTKVRSFGATPWGHFDLAGKLMNGLSSKAPFRATAAVPGPITIQGTFSPPSAIGSIPTIATAVSGSGWPGRCPKDSPVDPVGFYPLFFYSFILNPRRGSEIFFRFSSWTPRKSSRNFTIFSCI